MFAYGWPASGDDGGARAAFFDELRVLQFHSLHWIGWWWIFNLFDGGGDNIIPVAMDPRSACIVPGSGLSKCPIQWKLV